MKKLYGSFAAKLIAVILLCCLVLVFLGSVSAAVMIYKEGGYTGSFETMRKNYVGNLGERMLQTVGYDYMEGNLTENNMNSDLYFEPGSFWFEILDAKQEMVLSNYEGGKTQWEGWMSFTPRYSVVMSTAEEDDPYIVGPAAPEPQDAQTVWILRDYRDQSSHTFCSQADMNDWLQENTVTVRGYLPDPLPETFPEAGQLQILSWLYSWRYAFLWFIGLSFLLGVLIFIFLLCAAGHRKGTERIVPSFADRIPFDLFTVLILAVMLFCSLPINMGMDWPEDLVILILMILGFGLLFLFWCMSFAVRVKLGTLWSGCLTAKLLDMIVRGVKHLPILWKWALGIGVLALIDLFFRRGSVFSYNRTHVFWFLFWLLIGGATLYAVLAFRRLRMGAKEIASGNMGAVVEEKYLVGDLKDHAHDLNHIRDGLNDAVEQRMKSERFRTELITNVSHDIKTPLTSIVNYVDLMQKEEPKTEKQQEYLEVLSRQSGKLKKLIEDLIEASKASTGNLPVDLQPCDLSILLDQTAGEYAEKLEKVGLELVLQKPESPVTVMADGRHLWRVFDNLLNNIVKYAQPGTRVYLSLQRRTGEALVTFRNISREPLNISASELTERFVQGDASRHSDGNGLGLAIAMSLMRLQKGELEIEVDGDLFKVTLRFPAN